MRYIYEYYEGGTELSKSQISKIIKDAIDKHPLFKPLAKQMDLHRLSDENEDDMLEWLKQEANEIGCSSTLAYLGDYLGADLDDYKWRAVQALASFLAIDVMESEI